MKIKTLLYSFIIAAMLCIVCSNNAWADVTYTLSSGTLTFSYSGSGSSAMTDYADFDGSGSPKRPAGWTFSVTHVVINEGVTTIGSHAFQGCSSIQDISIPTSVTTCKAGAFTGCEAMTKIYYAGSPNQWAVIDFADETAHPFGALSSSADYYFYDNKSNRTTTLVFFPPLTEIKKYTFYRIYLSDGLSIPGTVSSIGNYAFYGCNIQGQMTINRKASPTMGTDAFRGVGTKRTLYVPSGATGYRTSGSNWYFTLSAQAVSGNTLNSYGSGITWKLREDGVLILDASNTETKSITFDAASTSTFPWYYFRRLVHKIVLKGEISSLYRTLRYHYGISEVILQQQTLPTHDGTYVGGTSYNALFDKSDTKLVLRIPPELEGNAGLNSAPWNDSHWEIVYPTVTLSKDTETNGTFTLSPSSLNSTSSAQTVSVTCTPNDGYVTSSVSATNPAILSGDITYAGSDNARTVTYPAYTHGSSTISAVFACATPTFSTNLSTEEVEYEQNAAASALSVTADANSGDLSYQWQSSSDNSSWSDIDGADEASFTPPTTETGTRYYHCIVTNTTCDESETSNAAQITITAPSPSAWNFWYGTNNADDWTHISFTYTGANNEWQTEVFAIPNKPNWNVNNAAGNDGKTLSTTWDNLYFAASQGDGDRPMVGDATGAIGTVRIYDNSNWNNRYAGFIPNGYVLKIGSTEYPFTFESGNEYRSEIFEYNSTNARDNVSVGIEDADGHFISTDNTSEMQHIFLHVGNNTTLWGKDNAKFVLYDVTNSSFTCAMTLVPGETCLYEGWVPSNCAKVIFVRRGDNTLSFDDKWDQTGDLSLLDNQNLFTISSFSDGSWSAYTQKGRFCIWQNSIEKNWGVCFRPCYEFNNTAGDGNWNTAGNWKPQSVPTIDFDVFLNKPVTVNVTTAQAKSIVINQEGGNTGQLVVDAGQKLIVAGTIQKTTNGETYSATEANDIIINSDATHGLGLGALVIGSHDGTNKATVNFTTLSNGTSEDNTSKAQYVGTPFNDETNILHNWYNSWVYGITYDGSKNIGWDRVNEGQGMASFKGYCVFSADGTHHNYWQQGTLVASENQTISGLNWQSGDGTANANNENLLANSWMAPIKINAMEASDFTNTEATIYIFNSTSASGYKEGGFESNYTEYTPGTAEDDDIIPAMQSFSVFTNTSGGSVSLDYNKIVYLPALDGTLPGPNHAPRRAQAESEEANKIRLFVRTESGYGDLLYMWERSDFSEAFENGWDGHKLFGESVAPQLFALSSDGDLAINCIPTFEGVQMGFKAGEQDNSYTLTFEYSDEAQPLYLLDMSTNTYTQITSAASYSFTTTDTEVHNRFVLTYNAPSTPTALETTPAVTTGKKVIYDNHLFILHNGRIFSAQGAMIQ